ncbi:hypothetical protein [Hoyosella altamirensis]|uniref:DUF7847 domain-containing protein n=1 Tax=Hoyosella altamirensis TaxID=616997 RepID=A0A839RSJ8_9ACTN|nr:hypothetical protein [Hoyosella altamirensis]MBB3039327.1 hypothetical protein [Hoyosella altamirensis]
MTQYPPGGQPPHGGGPGEPDDSGTGDQGWNPPSEPGGYPPPPPPQFGDYPPPPPPGGFGPQGSYPPPPPGGGGYGQASGEFRIGDGIRWAWNRFADNWAIWVGFTLIIGVVNIVFSFAGSTGRDPDDIFAFGFVDLLATIISAVLGWMMIRGALYTADGMKPSFGDFANLNNILHLAIASILVGIMTAIGFVLLIIPGLIVAFLSMFVTHFVLDQNVDAITGIKSSWSLVSKNVVPLLLLILTLFGLGLLGVITCGLGFLVILPLMTMLSVYAYRTLTGRQPAL